MSRNPDRPSQSRLASVPTLDALPDASSTTPLHLVAAADERYAVPLAVTLYSAVAHLPEGRSAIVTVISDGLSNETVQRLRRMLQRVEADVTLDVIAMNAAHLADYSIELSGPYSRAILLRLLLPDILPAVDRVVYLDSDVVVLRNLEALWAVPMNGKAVLGAPERTVACPERGVKRWRELGLPPDRPYVNSGVLVMNLAAWREDALGRKVLAYMDAYADAFHLYGDQEAINAVMGDRIGLLDPRWNVIGPYYMPKVFEREGLAAQIGRSREAVVSDPWIVHYTSPGKPWRADCPHPARHHFLRFLTASGFLSPLQALQFRLPFWERRLRIATRPWRQRVKAWMGR